jgi:hypothetical protein
MPLSSLEGASLRRGSTTSQIQLQLSGRDIALLSELNQSTGKEQGGSRYQSVFGGEANP